MNPQIVCLANTADASSRFAHCISSPMRLSSLDPFLTCAVKNSWGVGWGLGGYARIEMTDGGFGACGMYK